jgi:hypothetical protein
MPLQPRPTATGQQFEKQLEKDFGPTYITDGVDVDIVLSFLRVRNKGLDKELSQDTSGVLNLLLLTGSLSNPGLGFSPRLVQSQETALASALDELIGLRDELGIRLEEPRVGDLGLVQNILDVGILGKVQRSQSGRRVVLSWRGKRARLDDGSTSEMVVEDGLAVGLENRLGGHGGLLRRGIGMELKVRSNSVQERSI